MARVTYKLNGGNSALYFRAEEEYIPWVLKGFQNEIAGSSKDSALWHTRGKKTKGRGWVASNDELVAKVRTECRRRNRGGGICRNQVPPGIPGIRF